MRDDGGLGKMLKDGDVRSRRCRSLQTQEARRVREEQAGAWGSMQLHPKMSKFALEVQKPKGEGGSTLWSVGHGNLSEEAHAESVL